MPTRIAWLVAVFCLIAVGCVPSLHSLYTADDVAFDPALVGTWAEEDSNESWSFARDGEHAYTLEYTDNQGRPGRFEARLVELDGSRFLDLYPVQPDSGVNELYQLHLLKVHTFLHLKQVEPVLEMAFLEPDSVKALVERQPDAIRHEVVDGSIVLTASTEELRRFLPAQVAGGEAFQEYSSLTKSD